MIKARTGNTVILGLSDVNVQKMKEGNPIVVHLKDLDFQNDIKILIFTGKTEIEMQKAMKDGFGPNTVIIDNRFKQN